MYARIECEMTRGMTVAGGVVILLGMLLGCQGGPGSGINTMAPQGGPTCSHFFNCVQQCPNGADACAQSCYDQLNPSSRQIVDSTIACIRQSNCPDTTCLETACPSTVEACASDDGAARGPQAGDDGAACVEHAQCAGEACCTQEDCGLPGGYCTTVNCDQPGVECNGTKSQCFLLDQDDGFYACLQTCDGNQDCRTGYTCQPAGNAKLCLPGEEAQGAGDGSPCQADADCAGGLCILDDQGWPGGYCTTAPCDGRGCNGDNSDCLIFPDGSACFESCGADADCRPGYACAASGANAYCIPEQLAEEPTREDPEPETQSVDVSCMTNIVNEDAGQGFKLHEISFDLPQDVDSFLMVTLSDRQLVNAYLRSAGGTLDLQNDYQFMGVNSYLLGSVVPTLFPAAPGYEQYIRGGRNTFGVFAESDEVCWYVLSKSRPGTTLDVNIYLVGVPGLSANSAPNHRDLQAVLGEFDSLWGQAGVGLGQVRYIDVTGPDRDRYSVIRSMTDIGRLVATSKVPDDPLTLNVFLVDQFVIPANAGLLGVSQGIPGAAGYHGSISSGLVFHTADLGRDNDLLAVVMAHEVGHYLALRHTSEHRSGDTAFDQAFGQDPYSDTPLCDDPQRANGCPDFDYLMFPFADPSKNNRVSSQQGSAVRGNPLVR